MSRLKSLLVIAAFSLTTVMNAVAAPPASGSDGKGGVSASKTPFAKLVRLNKQGTVLLDLPGKRLLLKTKVVLREGILEMFCCLKKSKEHESILAVDAKAYVIHTGLLLLQTKPGLPVQYEPKFKPPSGQEIRIYVQWKDKNGRLHRADVQTWVRRATARYFVVPMKKLPAGFKLPDREKSELRFDKENGELFWYGHMTAKQRDEHKKLSADRNYRKAIESFFQRTRFVQMREKWVFAGSLFLVDNNGKRRYQAENGRLICLANFPSAMIDVAKKSSSSEGSVLFESYTGRIPPLETEVTLELIPVFSKKKRGESKKKPGESTKKPGKPRGASSNRN